MTNNLKEEIETILDVCSSHFEDAWGYPEAKDKALEAILALINQKEKEARLDEYAWYKREYPTAPYMPDFIIEDRIKQLKEELNKKGK